MTPGNVREAHAGLRQRRHERAVGELRHLLGGGGDALASTTDPRDQQRALDRRGVERILELLAAALRRRVAGAVLMARDEVDARRTASPAGPSLPSGRCASATRLHPVLVRRVDLHANGQVLVAVHFA